MDVTCTQENLATALQSVSRMVGTRGTLPVLNNILLATDKGQLKLSATDLEIGIETRIGGKVEADGALTVPARLLVDFVLTNTDPKIRLSANDTTLTLESDHFQANIKGIAASEFPQIPEIKRDHPITLVAADLKEAISQTVFATAVDETRPILSGVFLSVQGTIVKLAATDSYRLAERTLTLPSKGPELSVIIPARTLQELARLLSSSGTETINIFLAENQILFSFGTTAFISRLIDGAFPDYTQIIPKTEETSLELPKTQFAQVMKMASFFARENANNVRLTIDDSGLLVTAVSPQLGDTTSKLAAKVTGKPLEIAFNAKFILDALMIFPGETVRFGLASPHAPGILRPTDRTDYLYLIMPLRLDA